MKTKLTFFVLCFLFLVVVENTTAQSKIKKQIKDDSNGKILVIGVDDESKKEIIKDTTKKEESKKENKKTNTSGFSGVGSYVSSFVLKNRLDSCFLELGNKSAVISSQEKMISDRVSERDRLDDSLKTYKKLSDSLSLVITEKNKSGMSSFNIILILLLIGSYIGFFVFYNKKTKPVSDEEIKQGFLEKEEILQNKITELEKQIKDLKKEISEKNLKISELTTETQEQGAELDKANKELDEKTGEINRLKNTSSKPEEKTTQPDDTVVVSGTENEN